MSAYDPETAKYYHIVFNSGGTYGFHSSDRKEIEVYVHSQRNVHYVLELPRDDDVMDYAVLTGLHFEEVPEEVPY